MSTATDMQALYIAAEAAVLKGQSFEIAGKKMTLADLDKIRAGRREWDARVRDEAAAAAGRKGGLRYRTADFTSCG